MILFKLLLFVGLFLGITYGLEYILPPVGRLFYTNPLDILISLSQGIAYGLGIPFKYAFGFTISVIGLFPLIIVIYIGKKLKKKKNIKYKF